MPARATIDGIPILSTTPVSWHLSPGTQPYTTTVLVATKAVKGDSSKLIGKKTSLVVAGDKDGFTADNVYIIGAQPGPHPKMTALTIADLRWLWPRKHLLRRYNVRRKTGDRRLVTEGTPEQLTVAVDDYYYEVATLKDGKAWTPEDALRDAILYVTGDQPKTNGVTFRKTPFENVEVDDPGDSAIDRLRALSTGINIYVDLDGSVVLVDETDSSGARALRQFGDPVAGRGIAGFVDRSGLRPAYIDVLFSVEAELKFTSIDEGNVYSLRGDTRKFIENVLPLPDRQTTVGGRTLARGTIVTVDEAFAAWGTPTVSGAGGGVTIAPVPMTHDIVQKLWLGGLDRMFTDIGMLSLASTDWAARVQAVRSCYRQLYRISPYWMNRIKYLRASRVAITDRENGTHAPAYVTSHYSYSPNTRGRFFDSANQGWIVNVTDAYSDALATSKPAPCVLTIEDEQLGIVRLNYARDSRNLWDAVYPCAFGNLPSMSVKNGSTRPLTTGDSVYETPGNAAYLAASHKVAFVLTASPSAPNNNGQLMRIRVTAKQAEEAGVNVGAATAPGMEIRVGLGAASGAVARFMWTDAIEDQVDRLFGKGQSGGGGSVADYSHGDAMRNAGLLADADECQQIAKATAAAVYSSLTDRVLGVQAFRMGKATLRPTGNLVEVVFTEGTDGALNTIGSFNQSAGRVDVTSMLSSDVRRKLFRLAQP